MFGRLSSSIHVKARCRSPTLYRHKPCFTPASRIATASTRRWQGEAAIADQDDQEIILHQEDNDVKPDYRTLQKPSRPGTRHWRPIQDAELGLEVLGRPAKVLILPTRDRHISKIPSSEFNRPPTTIQASLEAETRPVSKAEIKANIEDVRTELQAEGQGVSAEVREEMKKRLASGFTKRQLINYFCEESGPPIDAGAETNVFKTRTKVHVADMIINRIWNLNLESMSVNEQPEVAPLEDEALPTVEEYVVTNRDTLDLLLREKSQPLKHLSDIFNIQIDVYRAEVKLRLEGEAEQVARGREALNQFLTPLLSRIIGLGDHTRQLLDDEVSRVRLCEGLMQRYAVSLEWHDYNLRVSARTEEQIESVQREIRLLIFDNRATSGHAIWPPSDVNAMIPIPYFPQDSRNLLAGDGRWLRCASKAATNHGLTAQQHLSTANLGSLISPMLGHIQRHEEVMLGQDWKVDYTCSAALGQVLYQHSASDADILEQVRSQQPCNTLFTTRIPFVHQNMDQLDSNKEISTKMSNSYRIRLHPLQYGDGLPSFEVTMVRSNDHSNLKEPLRMREVSMILRTSIFDVLLPSLPLDLRITQQSFVSLFNHSSSKPLGNSLPLLKVFASKIQWVDDRLSMSSPIWALDLSNIISTPTDVGKQESGDVSRVIQPDHYKLNLAEIPYIVEPPETLDTLSRELLNSPGFSLRHTLAHAGPDHSPYASESLQIVETAADETWKSITSKRGGRKAPAISKKLATHMNTESRIAALLKAAITHAADVDKQSRLASKQPV